MRLVGAPRRSLNTAGVKGRRPLEPQLGQRRHQALGAARQRRHDTPATFSSSTASGSAHRWRRMSSGSSACTSPSRTRCRACRAQAHALGCARGARGEGQLGRAGRHGQALRRQTQHTTPARSAMSRSLRKACGQRVGQGRHGQQRVDTGHLQARVRSAPAVKNSGSGTCTTPACSAARSATTQGMPLSISVASTRVPSERSPSASDRHFVVQRRSGPGCAGRRPAQTSGSAEACIMRPCPWPGGAAASAAPAASALPARPGGARSSCPTHWPVRPAHSRPRAPAPAA